MLIGKINYIVIIINNYNVCCPATGLIIYNIINTRSWFHSKGAFFGVPRRPGLDITTVLSSDTTKGNNLVRYSSVEEGIRPQLGCAHAVRVAPLNFWELIAVSSATSGIMQYGIISSSQDIKLLNKLLYLISDICVSE